MTISFINEAHQYQCYAGSLTINKPTNTASGDLMIAIVGGTKSSTPSGWTQLSDVDSGGSSTGHVYVYYKIAGGSEPSSYTFNQSPGTGSYYTPGAILTYRGADSTTPIDSSDSSVSGMSSGGTNYNTASVTTSGTQWALSFALSYESGTTTVRTFTEGTGTERLDFGNGQSSETTSLMVCDSNANVSSGSFSRTQTASATTAKGAKGIVLINDSGISAPANAASGVSATAYVASVLTSTVGTGGATTTAHAATVLVSAVADVADDVTAVANGAVKSNPAGTVSLTAAAYGASVALEARPHVAEVTTDAKVPVAYYGAPVVRVYFVPNENRTYIVRR